MQCKNTTQHSKPNHSLKRCASMPDSDDEILKPGNTTRILQPEISYITLLGVCFVAAFILNSLVIWSLVRRSGLSTSVGIRLLFSLCVSNLVLIATIPFVIVSVVFGEWIFPEVICNIIGMCFTMVMISSWITQVAIAYDRYVAIVNSMKYNEIMPVHRATNMLIGIWAMALFLAFIPSILSLTFFQYDATRYMCVFPAERNYFHVIAFTGSY